LEQGERKWQRTLNQTRLISFEKCQHAKKVRGSSTEVEHFAQSLKIKGLMPTVGTGRENMAENSKPDQIKQF
jgi:hypothetical protein